MEQLPRSMNEAVHVLRDDHPNGEGTNNLGSALSKDYSYDGCHKDIYKKLSPRKERRHFAKEPFQASNVLDQSRQFSLQEQFERTGV